MPLSLHMSVGSDHTLNDNSSSSLSCVELSKNYNWRLIIILKSLEAIDNDSVATLFACVSDVDWSTIDSGRLFHIGKTRGIGGTSKVVAAVVVVVLSSSWGERRKSLWNSLWCGRNFLSFTHPPPSSSSSSSRPAFQSIATTAAAAAPCEKSSHKKTSQHKAKQQQCVCVCRLCDEKISLSLRRQTDGQTTPPSFYCYYTLTSAHDETRPT